MRRVAASIAALALLAAASAVRAQAEPSRAIELVRAIAQHGADVGCDAAAIARIARLTVDASGEQERRNERRWRLLDDQGRERGRLARHDSTARDGSAREACNASVLLEPGELCDVLSPAYAQAVGHRPAYRTPHHGPPVEPPRQSILEHEFRPRSGTWPDRVFLVSRVGDRCMHEVRMHTRRGDWHVL
jgi:hypothetical protein